MSVDDLESYHVLHWLASALKPRSYLEVGVREGASLCCVMGLEPEIVDFAMTCLMDGQTEITEEIVQRIHEGFTNRDPAMMVHLFDNWSYMKDGTGFRIKKLLEEGFNHREYVVHDGDSKTTLPSFFKDNDSIFDLVLIDGDHRLEGVWSDLRNVAGKFKVLVAHDLYHPQHRHVIDVFNEYVKAHGYPSFVVGKRRLGVGVAFNLN